MYIIIELIFDLNKKYLVHSHNKQMLGHPTA
ncbi:MAG: hypothetical protein J07HQX50_01250 [Haloquadratum sp. J07HQX50]|nr:MAG: hypothetical protein J07HQX50_01250 [Haloquadratum sp. J07HQX50]